MGKDFWLGSSDLRASDFIDIDEIETVSYVSPDCYNCTCFIDGHCVASECVWEEP